METDKTREVPEQPKGKIKLMNGRIIDGFPKKKSENVPDNMLSMDTSGLFFRISKKTISEEHTKQEKDLQKEMFLKNAFFLYSQRERIYGDSRMFLAPVPIENALAYTGTSGFHRITLGIYLEWWDSCDASIVMTTDGGIKLVSCVIGSPLSGGNSCTTVDPQGNIGSVSLPDFLSAWSSLMHVNTRYNECKTLYQAYSIGQVVEMLDKGTSHEHQLDGTLFQLKARCLEKKLRLMEDKYQRLQDNYDTLKGKWTVQSIIDKLEQVKEAVNSYHALEARTNAEWTELNKKRAQCRQEKGNVTPQAFQKQMVEIKKKKASLKQALDTYKTDQEKKIFPDGGIHFIDMERYMEQHECEQKNIIND